MLSELVAFPAVSAQVVPKDAWSLEGDCEVTCRVNGDLRQHGRIKEMIWTLPGTLRRLINAAQ